MVNNIYQIDRYELNDYCFSYSVLPQIIKEREMVISELYEDCCATTVQRNDIGMLVPMSVNPCDMAIAIIEQKESYDNMIKRYEGKAKLFEQAMDLLTDRERQVIQVFYFQRENDLNLSDEYFRQVLHDAESKLCGTISEMQESKFELMRLEEHQRKLEAVAEYMKAN